MSAPWFRVESNMVTHPKVYKLAEILNLKPTGGVKANVAAAGLMLGVWSWATQNAPDGDLSRSTPAAIAEAAGWTKKPQLFLEALIEAGFVDKDGDELWLHDWINYAEKLAEQENKKKAATAERVRKHRDSKRRASNAECNGYSNATVTECNAPYITEHNITVHNNPIYQDRRKDIDNVQRDDVTVTSSLPDWVNDPEYIPTVAEIEALPPTCPFSIRAELTRRRTLHIMRGPSEG